VFFQPDENGLTLFKPVRRYRAILEEQIDVADTGKDIDCLPGKFNAEREK
jgi:hypothetical protein